MALVRSLLTALLVLALSAGAEAGQFVQFKSADVQLTGYLARPRGAWAFSGPRSAARQP
jgi:hypothetical protein